MKVKVNDVTYKVRLTLTSDEYADLEEALRFAAVHHAAEEHLTESQRKAAETLYDAL